MLWCLCMHITIYSLLCYAEYTDMAGNLGADRQKYSSRPTFDRERARAASSYSAHYSSKTQPASERPGMEDIDPYNAKSQYRMNDNHNTGHTTSSVNSRPTRSNVLNQLKTTNDRLSEFSVRPAAGEMADNRYPDNQQNPHSRRAADIFPSSDHRNPYTVGSGMNKHFGNSRSRAEISSGDDREPYAPGSGRESKPYALAGRGNEDTQMYQERQRTGRQTQLSANSYSASSPREVRPPPPPLSYGSSRERTYAEASMAVGTTENRESRAAKRYASVAEDDLRRSLYDRRYHEEVAATMQKRQAEVLGSCRSAGRDLDRAPGGRLDLGRARYDSGDRVAEAGDGRRRDAGMSSSGALSKFDQRRDYVVDPSATARKPFARNDVNGKD